jgi:hypothetical protein
MNTEVIACHAPETEAEPKNRHLSKMRVLLTVPAAALGEGVTAVVLKFSGGIAVSVGGGGVGLIFYVILWMKVMKWTVNASALTAISVSAGLTGFGGPESSSC